MGSSSETRDRTQAPCIESAVILATGSPGKFLECTVPFYVPFLALSIIAMASDTSYLESHRRLRSTQLPSIQTPATNLGVPRITLSSEQLAINSGVPMTTLRFDNLLEQLIEFKEVLFLGIVFYYNQTDKNT